MSLRKTAKLILIGFICSAMLGACNSKKDDGTIIIGTIAGPETELMQVAQKVAEKEYGLKVKVLEFSDYIMPNTALNDGSINANMFQHQPYLTQTTQDRGYKLVAIGKTYIYPMAGYSKKYKKLADLPQGAKVAIPNDPSNSARALLLLQKAGLITLKSNNMTSASIADISKNPRQINITELDAAQLPRVLDDIDLAVINTNYAIPANLIPKRDALIIEGADSLYANVVVVREEDKNNPKLQQLVAALHSEEVQRTADRLFHQQAIKAW